MLQKLANRDQKGFTLIELMIVIAIIGILAAIAIPNFVQYRKRAYDSAAKSDVKNAYTAAQAYFTDWPEATTIGLDTTKILTAGFRETTGVDITITNGTPSGLNMYTEHTRGGKRYTIDAGGDITESAKP